MTSSIKPTNLTDAQIFLASFAVLSHYASPYYDPVKAHEYYMRTRVLKGRKPAQKLSAASKQKQREGLLYAKEQVRTKRAADLKSSAKAQEAKLKALQTNATKRRDAITKKLNDRVTQLKAQADSIRKNAISATANEKLKNYLNKQNVYRTNKANAQANKEAQEAARAANEEIKKVGSDLKDAVKKARESYTASRKAMIERYNKDLKNEVQNIQNKVR